MIITYMLNLNVLFLSHKQFIKAAAKQSFPTAQLPALLLQLRITGFVELSCFQLWNCVQ